MSQPWNQPYGQPGWSGGPPAAPGGWSHNPAPTGWPAGPAPVSGGPAPVPVGPTRNPLRLVLLAAIALSVVALIGLAVAGLTAKPTEVAYQNEDYQVPTAQLDPPAIPAPQDAAQAVEWTKANAVYQQSAPVPVRCSVQPLDVATADDASLKTHFESQIECLMRVWEPPLTAAGFQIFRPTVTIYTDQISTACGSGDQSHNAFYCSEDQQIYWSNTLGGDLTPFSRDRWAGDSVMAHEFGHAVQGRTGILASRNALYRASDDKAERLELRRRNETQADCFAGMYLRSVSRSIGLTQADVPVIEDGFASGGDDVIADIKPGEGDHGQSSSRRFWGTTGLTSSQAASCNTYAAPPAQVR